MSLVYFGQTFEHFLETSMRIWNLLINIYDAIYGYFSAIQI